jgi:hypothetical protein
MEERVARGALLQAVVRLLLPPRPRSTHDKQHPEARGGCRRSANLARRAGSTAVAKGLRQRMASVQRCTCSLQTTLMAQAR